MKNKYLMTVIVALFVGILAFIAGMKYQSSQISRRANLGRQFIAGNNTYGGQNNQGRFGAGIRPVIGEIISFDDKSISVKLQDGSSKIVLLTASTLLTISAEASKSDLIRGVKVLATGAENSDGSVTASNIQLNPSFGGIDNNRMPTQIP